MESELFTFVLEKLADLLAKEIKLLSTNSKENLEALERVLQLAQSYLMDTDQVQQRSKMSHLSETHVKHIMEKVSEIEDFLDKFYQEEEEEKTRRGKFVCFPCTSNPIVRKHGVIKGATKLKQGLLDTLQAIQSYQQPSSILPPQFTPRRRLPTQSDIVKEESILSLEKDVEAYLAQLAPRGCECSTDLAIVGMGGAGKTTLARKIYNHKCIADHFDTCAWVYVSQEPDQKQLLREICAQVRVKLQGEEKTFPSIKLKEFLGSKSCFFILDDVWKMEDLKELLLILRSGNGKGRTSRVLVTTRNKDIFGFPQNDFSIDEIRPLTLEESWSLFLMTLERNHWQDGDHIDGEFVLLGKEMVAKCKGLPLAIVALAGLLSTKITTQDWECIKDDVVPKIMSLHGTEDAYGVVKEILELSYIDLPYQLKPCFVYLGIFQEDCEIDAATLIELWISEGFVKPNQSQGCRPEEVATDCLDVLVQRSMVEVVRRDYDGKVVTIRVHDLMRELCLEKAKTLNLYEISPPSASLSTTTNPLAYRIIIHNRRFFGIANKNQRVRSYIWQEDKIMKPIELDLRRNPMKFIRVLCLIRVDLMKTKMQLGELILLRYLDLKFCRVSQESLQSIKKLRNLLTFKYQGSGNYKLSDNMVGEMNHLRHLYLPIGVDGGKKLGVNNKGDLQILKVVVGEWLTLELQHVSITLQQLHLIDLQSEAQLEAVYDFVSNRCQHLRELSLSLKFDSDEQFDLDKIGSRHCASLELKGKMKSKAFKFPSRLVKLCLVETKIEEEEHLRGALSELRELRCLMLGVEAYRAGRLSMTGLQKLEKLELSGLPFLKEWTIEKGALSKLHELEIITCDKLARLPDEIGCLCNLRRFLVDGMPPAFAKRLQPRRSSREGGDGVVEGEDFHLISHIPFIKVEGSDE